MIPGTQPPRFHWAPPAISTALAEEMADLAESVGWALDPWQRANFIQNCATNERDEWISTEVGLVVTRQNGKNGEIVAREIGGLVLLGERLQTHTAHRFDTAAEHFLVMRQLFEGVPDLSRLLKRNGIRASHGEEAIELKSGARLLFKARSKSGGRGFAGNLIIFDEAFYLGDLGALIPTLSAQYNPQVWYTSSAPLRREESKPLRKLIRRGRALARGEGDPENDTLSYAEWSSEDINLDDDEAVLNSIRLANPSLGMVRKNGTGLSLAYILGTERATLDDEEFARERLGIFDDGESAASEIPTPEWLACEDETAVLSGAPLAFAVDIGPDQAWASIAAAGHDADGNAYAEIVDRRRGSAWLIPRLEELEKKYPDTRRVADLSGPVRAIAEEAKGAGVKLEAVSTGEHAGACALLKRLVIDGGLRHRPDPDLDASIVGAKKRDMGDGLWVWSRRSSAVDITPLVAFGLAVWASGAGEVVKVVGSLMVSSESDEERERNADAV